MPSEEFDFEGMNAKFESQKLSTEKEESPQPNTDAFYDKKSSFFDNISCESKDKADGRDEDRKPRHEENKINLETFGQTHIPHYYHGHHGRGRGGYSGGGSGNRSEGGYSGGNRNEGSYSGGGGNRSEGGYSGGGGYGGGNRNEGGYSGGGRGGYSGGGGYRGGYQGDRNYGYSNRYNNDGNRKSTQTS